MELLDISIKSFKTFKSAQVFTFPSGPGLFFVTGKNLVNPRLGANGTGKTTMWEALFWLFFDKIPSGRRAGDLAPWSGEDGTEVILRYRKDGEVYRAGRSWKPNKWWLEHHGQVDTLVADESNLLLKHLGTEALPFLNTILMAQEEQRFLDMKPDAMASLFGEVMRLDHWVDLSAKASKAAILQDSSTRVLESTCSRLSGAIEALDLSGTEKSYQQWEAERSARLDELESRYRILLGEDLGEATKELERCSDLLDASAKALQEAQDAKEVADRELFTAEEALIRERSSKDQRDRECDALERRASKIDSEKVCNSCGQDIGPEHRRARMKALDEEIDALLEKYDKAAELVQEAEKTLSARDLARSRAMDRLKDASDAFRDAERAKSQASFAVSRINAELDRLESEHREVENKKNPIQEIKRRAESARKQLQAELAEAERERDQSDYEFKLKQFWVRGFKDIRLEEISRALTQLEVEVNSCVTKLGLVGWSLFFDVDSETKKSTVKRGFNVKVMSPDNDKAVPWAMWSGGEKQRLRAAAQMGMANLIRSRLGVTLPIEVWDEPTQYLSEQGVSDLLNALKDRAIDEGRQIWIVDHRSLGYGGFTGTYTVVKDKDGSYFKSAV